MRRLSYGACLYLTLSAFSAGAVELDLAYLAKLGAGRVVVSGKGNGLASRLALIDADGAIARADMEKRQAEARGKAARIVEDGRATAAVLTQMIETWKAAGPNARDIFLMQKLQTVTSSLVETIQSVKVDRISYLPANARVTQGIQLVEQVKTAFGVDLAKVVARLGAPAEKTTTGAEETPDDPIVTIHRDDIGHNRLYEQRQP